ncbi:MAG: hypothetical protein GXP62_03650, partial [Oligoflexia bacterium]|nr:hypothetical protein [Oligoflexia bacterium]
MSAQLRSVYSHGVGLARRHGLLLLVLWTMASYAGVMGAGFVWDDDGLVVHNSLTASLSNIPGFFLVDMWQGTPGLVSGSGYYRPLVLLSLALDRALFGQWALGFHLHSLAWHLAAVIVLHRLALRLLPWSQALVVAGVFALHPAQSEAVVWIAARNDPMAAALGLGALLAVWPARASTGRLAAGAVLAWAALMAKESVLVLPVLLLLLDWLAGTSFRLRRYLALLLGLAVGVGLRLVAGVAGAAWPEPIGWHLMATEAVRVVGVYGATLSVAWPLSAVRSLEWLSLEPRWRTLVGVGTVGVLALAPLLTRGHRRRLCIVGFAWLALTVLPTLVSVADKGLIGDRYVYLGLAGLGLWLCGAAGRAAPVVLALAVLPWQGILRARLPDWRSDHAMWLAAVEDTASPYAMAGLGRSWLRAKRPGLALPMFVAALDQDPPALDACDFIGDAAVALGRLEMSEQLGRWALSRGCPKSGLLVGNLALSQAWLGHWDRAELTLEGASADPRERDLVVRGG